MYELKVNGKVVTVDVDPDTPLLWAVREELGLTGTKFGCGLAQCGACTMNIDGVATRTCVLPASAAVGRDIRTIEGVTPEAGLSPVQQAWTELEVPQCGYCQSGQIMAATALLEQNPSPTDQDIDNAMTNICRCATYHRIRAAVHRAADLAKEA